MGLIRGLAHVLAVALVFAAGGAAAQTAQTQTFPAPQLHGYLVDWCAHFGRDCGKPAADLFCRELKFDQASNFSIDQNAGARGLSTLVFGDGSLCTGNNCAAFRQITCTKAVAAAPPPASREGPPTLFVAPPPQPPPQVTPQPPPVIAQPPRTPPPSAPPPVIVQPPRVPPSQPPPVIAQPPPPVPPSSTPPVVAQPLPVPVPRLRPAPPQVAQNEPVKPNITPLDPAEIAKNTFGEIHLVAPYVEPDYLVEIANPKAGQIPLWDDETVFKWKPSNPGMADTYELRFYNALSATTPIASVKIPGNQTYKRTTIDFLQELLAGLGITPGINDDLWSLLWDAMGVKQGNLLWEVAGYRNYPTSGVADDGSGGGGDTFEAQVAVSERWPLRAPDRANGYGACGPGENQAQDINPAALELRNEDQLADPSRPAGIDYVYDLISIKGSFTLAMSPYAAHPKTVMAPPKPENLINIDVAGFQFDNLFIDWGDGTVEPLNPSSLDHGQWGRSTPLGLPGDPPAQHRYQSAGSYYIRIFQVSEQDLQQVHVATLNVANQVAQAAGKVQLGQGGAQNGGASPAPIQAGAYYDALVQQQGGGGPGASALAPTAQAKAGNVTILQGGFPLDVANRAYVIYCQHITPTERMDDVAFGELNLYTADIRFDDSHAVDKANPIAANVAVCDQSAEAKLHVTYLGKGTATLTWKIDGVMIGGVTEVNIGPSPARSSAELFNKSTPNKGDWDSDWVPLQVSEALKGGHEVTAEIAVKTPAVRGPLKLLRPSKQGDPNAPPVIETTIQFVPIFLDDGSVPKKALTAAPRTYTVVDNASGKPCHLRFLVAGGAFDAYVSDADQITANGDIYSGKANLLVPFANLGHQPTVPITFSGWQVANNGDVVAGTLAVDAIAENMHLPGLDVTLQALSGSAGANDGAVQATIDVEAEGGGLRSTTGGGAKPPKWTGEKATLAPDGDWYEALAGSGISELQIGWSGFLIEADAVALDFSAVEGGGPSNAQCGAAGSDWIGARLDTAKVEPNLFHLDTVKMPVNGWVVGAAPSGNGLCGDLDVGEPVPKRAVGEGKMAIHHLTATVRGGFLKNANYDMEVEVPLLGVTLTGNGTLVQASGQEPTWNLSGLAGPAADLQLGTVRLQADTYQFGTSATNWRVIANTKLTLAAEGNPFTTVKANGVRFDLDGRVYFDDAALATRTVPLSGSATLGQNTVALKAATLTGGGTGATRLGIQVATNLHLSDALPAPDVDVGYAVLESGGNVSATGPTSGPFEVKVAFPAADPGMSATIHPQYVGNQNAGTPQSGIKFYAGPGNAAVDFFASNSPVQSAFVLGYSGNKDYWMTLSDYSLGPTGTPLVAPIINLFDISGGLGYHVQSDKFVGLGDVRNITPSTGTGLTFLAGITAGTPDHTTFTLDGQLKMTETDKVRMDFTAWLLKQKSGSTGDFTGFIQYGGGSFDGQIWGGLSMLDGAVKVSADQGAVDMHFGSGAPWHIYLGRREGPKIQTTLLNLGGTSGYLMLSGEGFFVGSGANINLGGSIGPFSASVKGWLDAELGIEPLKPRVSGTATGGLSVKGCAFGACIGPDASVTVKMAALPVDVSAKACFEIDLVLKTVGACGSVSL